MPESNTESPDERFARVQPEVELLVQECDAIRGLKLDPDEEKKRIDAVNAKITELRGGLRGHLKGVGVFRTPI